MSPEPPNLFKIRPDLRKLWRNTFWCVFMPHSVDDVPFAGNVLSEMLTLFVDFVPKDL